ncbi:MAG TPA: hypothetical protein VGU45_02030 [Microvirga sp.]|jgi:hypothetical protein|nr:hypothetical protein [Microvirga sp.]
MTKKTFIVVQTFSRSDLGDEVFVTDRPLPVQSKGEARAILESLGPEKFGGFAFTRVMDFELGDYEDAVVFAKVGDCPYDPSQQQDWA